MDPKARPLSPSRAEARAAATSVVIPVSDVVPADTPLREVPYSAAVEVLLTPPHPFDRQRDRTRRPECPVAACAQYHGRLVADVEYHPVVAAATLAFNDHRTLTLSPDMIWLLIAQGFAHHVNANAETLRRRLVHHQGKLTIKVRRDDFVKESPENPWPEVFDEFARHIRQHVGEETYAMLRPAFSTTGSTERAAADVVLLDTMQSFFTYFVRSMCGIPTIVLEGSLADWRSVASRARELARFDLGWWIDPLATILDEFVEAASGRVNRRFWESICKIDSMSGGPFTSGWITAFFPYLKEHYERSIVPNPSLRRGERHLRHILFPPDEEERKALLNSTGLPMGPTADEFPGGLSRAPFTWLYHGESHPMEFLGGFVGVRQDGATCALRPEIGWAVRSTA